MKVSMDMVSRLGRSREWNDYVSALRELRSVIRHARSPESLTLALSALSCDSLAAQAGCLSWYQVIIVNNSPDLVWLKLIFDIYLAGNAVHPEGHFGYFDKAIMVRPLSSQDVQIGFDWKECAVFRIEGVDFPADGLWRGPCRGAGVYAVRVMAAGAQGEALAHLEIHQELSR